MYVSTQIRQMATLYMYTYTHAKMPTRGDITVQTKETE